MAGRWFWTTVIVVAAAAAGVVVARRWADGTTPVAEPPDGHASAMTTAPHDGVPDDASSPETFVTVRVLARADNAPIAGAHVTVRTGGDEAPGPSASGDTGADGRVRLSFKDATGPFDVTVRAASHMGDTQSLDEKQVSAEIVSCLDPAGRVRGVVRDTDGKPVAGVKVFLERDEDDGRTPDEVVTAASGSFDIDGVPLGETFGVVALGSGDDDRIAVRRGLSIGAAGQSIDVDLTLAEPARLSVSVVWPDGLPIAGAAVGLASDPGVDQRTGPAGTAVFGPQPPHHTQVTARCWGFADATAEIELRPGAKERMVLRPKPGPVIAGVVVDEDGIPIAGAHLELDYPAAPTFASDVDGTFRIACPDADTRTLDVSAAGFASEQVADVVPPSEGLRVVLRNCRVRFRLVWPAGAPHTGRVHAWTDGSVAEATLDGDVVRITVPPGTTQVKLAVEGCVSAEIDVPDNADESKDWGDVVLERAARLEGRVVDEQGKPVDAFVYAKVGDTTVPLESTGEDGSFSIDNLPEGDAEVRVEAKGFVTRTTRHALAAGGPQLVVALARGGGVNGVVLGADGKPAQGVVYVVFTDVNDPENRERMAWPSVEEDGRFEVHLAPGRYRAQTSLDDREVSAEVDVADGETLELTLKFAAPR